MRFSNLGVTGLASGNPFTAAGNVTLVISNRSGDATGDFQGTLSCLDITGSLGPDSFDIEDSPTPPAADALQISDLGDGDFRISSFFDVFTQINLDQTGFTPASGAATFESADFAPEPGTLLLLAGAGIVLGVGKLRR